MVTADAVEQAPQATATVAARMALGVLRRSLGALFRAAAIKDTPTGENVPRVYPDQRFPGYIYEPKVSVSI
jgi:hypothetical protein